MDVVCAALALSARSLAVSDAAAPQSLSSSWVKRDANTLDVASASPTEKLVFQLCRRLSTVAARTINAPPSATGENPQTCETRARILWVLLERGAARCHIVRRCLWTDVGALPPCTAPELVSSSQKVLTLSGSGTVRRWVASALWAETLAARGTPHDTTIPADTDEDVVGVVRRYARCCALIPQHFPSYPPQPVTSSAGTQPPPLRGLCHLRELPPVVWLHAFLRDHNGRSELLDRLLSDRRDDMAALEEFVVWPQCEPILSVPLLHASPSAYFDWCVQSLPRGFEARLCAHVFFVLAAFYSSPPPGQEGGEEAVQPEVMSHSRFRRLLLAYVSRDFTRQPFYALRGLSDAPRNEAKDEPTSGPPAAEEDEGTFLSEAASVLSAVSHETLAVTFANCFVAHALHHGAEALRGVVAVPTALSEDRAHPSAPSAVPQVDNALTQLLRCLEAHGPSYDLTRDASEDVAPNLQNAQPHCPANTVVQPSVMMAHKAMAAALALLATSGESTVALYLRSQFPPLTSPAVALASTDADAASNTGAMTLRVLSHPAFAVPWSTSALTVCDTASPSVAAESVGARGPVFDFLAHDPSPFVVPSSLSEIRDSDDGAHARLVGSLLSPAHTARDSSGPATAEAARDPALRSPFSTVAAMVATLLRHPWVQLSLLEQIWALCTALTAAPGDDDLRDALGHRLRALYEIYVHSVVEAGVGATGTAKEATDDGQSEWLANTRPCTPPPAAPESEGQTRRDEPATAVSGASTTTDKNEETPPSVPRRRLKLSSAVTGTAANTDHTTAHRRRSLALGKRPRTESAEEAVASAVKTETEQEGGVAASGEAPRHQSDPLFTGQGDESLLAFDAAVLQWSASPPAESDFSLRTAITEALLSFTRLVQEPLFDVLACVKETSADGERAGVSTVPRMRLSLSMPSCAAQWHQLASAQVACHPVAASTRATASPVEAGVAEALGLVMGTLMSYFTFRWTLLVRRCATSSAQTGPLLAESLLRLQRLVGPVLNAWPRDARRYLCYVPVGTRLLPQLLQSDSPRDGASAAGPWDGWRAFLAEQNLAPPSS